MNALTTTPKNEMSIADEQQLFELVQRKAKLLASSDFVPDTFKGNVANCSLIVEMAHRLKTDPFLISRQIYIVHNKPAFSSKFLIALLNKSGALKGRLRYEVCGDIKDDSHGIRAWGIDAATGDTLHGPYITIAMAKAEGWYGKNGSKWKTLPDLMLQYRAATFFMAINYPELQMGMASTEELYDAPEERDITPAYEDIADPQYSDDPAIDTETGEVLDIDDGAQAFDDLPPSKAFVALREAVLNSSDKASLKRLLSDKRLKDCEEAEEFQLTGMIQQRIDALDAGLRPQAQ